MNLKALPVPLLLATLMLMFAACSAGNGISVNSGPSAADIEATVQARVLDALEATVKALPEPTPTEVATTPVSKAIPEVEPTHTPTPGADAPGEQSVADISSTDKPSTSSHSNFTMTAELCKDEQGPDCTRLRLGDGYHTTSMPKKGHLYSCNEKNPTAPGSTEGKLTWINFTENVWDFLRKPWLPEGDFSPESGIYTETLSTEDRQIDIDNLPVDGKIGDWPMTDYPTLTKIDRNPGIPSSSSSSFTYPVSPSEAPLPICVSLGAIGVTKNGVVIYNAVDGRGNDAVAHEIVDVFGGHPAMTNYHYHFIPERLDNDYLSGGHSGVAGYINDGFPIYGYRGEGGVEMSNEDLDLCHGHKHGALGYHYHATIEYPYTVGCYKGTPITTSNAGPPGGRPLR